MYLLNNCCITVALCKSVCVIVVTLHNHVKAVLHHAKHFSGTFNTKTTTFQKILLHLNNHFTIYIYGQMVCIIPDTYKLTVIVTTHNHVKKLANHDNV